MNYKLANDGNGDAARLAGTTQWFTPLRFGLILALAIVATFPKVVLGWDSFFYRDYGVLAYPFAYFQHENFWRGEFLQWNPFSHCGVPFLAQWGTNFYPPSLIYLVLPLPWSLNIYSLLHLLLAGLGMQALAFRWTGCRFAAAVAGLVYVFSGVTQSCLMWPNYMVALGWMPWVVLCAERGWREGGRRMVLAVVVAAMQLFSGVPEIIVLTWLVVGVLWLDEFFQAGVKRVPHISRLAGIVLLAAGLFAVQLLPFLDLLAHSQRDTGFGTSKWAMPIWGWANLLVPLFHSFETPQGPWFVEGQEFINSYYLGAGVLVLAVAAVWRVRERRVWWLAALLVFSLVMAWGERGGVFVWVKKLIPFLGIARYPIKFVMLAVFVAPLLIAWLFSRLESSPEERGKILKTIKVFGAAALLAMGVILCCAKAWPFPYDQWPATWQNALARALFLVALLVTVAWLYHGAGGARLFVAQAAVLLIVLLDFRTHVPVLNPTLPASVFAPGFWEQSGGRQPPKLGQSRILITPAAEKLLLRSTVKNQQMDFAGKRLAGWSNLNLLDGVPKVNGAVTLQIREQKQVESLIYATNAVYGAGLLDFLAVSHISSPDSPVEWVTRSNFCPVVTCGQKPVFENAENTLRQLAAADFNPRRVVYLPPESRANVSACNQTECVIVASRFAAGRVEVEVAAREPSLVVLSQTFYHPWRAQVDDQPATLLRANHAFQAVQVPAGRHRITLVYRDRNLLIGACVSGFTALLCLVLALRGRRAGASASKPEAEIHFFNAPSAAA